MASQYFHVVFPTYKRLPILLDQACNQFITEIIVDMIAQKKINVLEFKVLTDHIHLLMVEESGNNYLPRTIKLIKGRTTTYFFKKYRDFKIDIGRGRLWAKGYHTTRIQNQKHLDNTIGYIQNNFDKYKDCYKT